MRHDVIHELKPDPKAWHATFCAVREAAKNPKDHTLCVHMWEGYTEDCRTEIADKLAVMAGDEKASYDDSYRFQHGDEAHGMVALSTTGLAAKANIKVFDELGSDTRTGLLLIDAPPVVVMNRDLRSRYSQPADEFTVYLKHDAGNHEQHKLSRELRRMQAIPLAGTGYMNFAPKAVNVMKCARKAYAYMMNALQEQPDVEHVHNEVCVNAKTEHIAAILAQQSGKGSPPQTADEWKCAMRGDPEFARSMYFALEQYDQLRQSGAQEASGREPTIVVYRPAAEEKFVHFPPTRAHRRLVEQSVKHAVDLGAINPVDLEINRCSCA